MARVFPKPAYTGDTSRAIDSFKEMSAWAASRMAEASDPVFEYVFNEDEFASEGITMEAFMAKHGSLSDLVRHTRVSAATVAALCNQRGVRALCDGDAADAAFKVILAKAPRSHGKANPANDQVFGRAMAAAGCIAGLASPAACTDVISSVKFADVICPGGALAVDMLRSADHIRLGSAPARYTAAFSAYWKMMEIDSEVGAGMLDSLEIRGSPISSVFTGSRVWFCGKYICVEAGRNMIVLDETSRANLASCVYSYGMWCIVSANSNSNVGKDSIGYVHNVLMSARAPKSWELARYLKSEYAVSICKSQAGGSDEFFKNQVLGLDAECEAARPASVTTRFSDVIGTGADAVNFGTVWNVLPPCSIDTSEFVESLRSKVSVKHAFDEASWADFTEYALSTVSAHYLAANPQAEVKWSSQRGDDPDWAAKCRDGTLTYPSRSSVDWIVSSIPWVRVMESWHHSAQDVTHVHADLSEDVDNELEYALEHAPRLSKRYKPEDIRRAWEGDNVPGDRVLYVAAKSENTKFGAKARETMSGDDILREILSEVDVNLTTIGHVIDGVTTRRGRGAVESMIKKVVGNLDADRVLLSLDVSGWSPNMVRDKELEFIDRLMSMYDLPGGMSVKKLFGTPTIVFDKGAEKITFPMVDGSVQGFFGTADTILHSLMAQWAFSNGKSDGVFARSAKIKKAVLIDDIIACLTGCEIVRGKAVEYFCKQYGRLGFKVDVVKTLASPNIGTFLNRVYTPTGEMLTYAKIASRADREWDRPVVGICDEVGSIFGSFAGAVDRGMNSVVAYTIACCRAAMRIRATRGEGWNVPDSFFVCCFLAPATLGGIGAPSITEWVTGVGSDAVENKLANISCVLAQSKAGNYKGYDNLEYAVRSMLGKDIVPRRASSVWADPGAVKLKGVTDAREPVKRALKDVLSRKFGGSMFFALATCKPSGDALRFIDEAVSSGAYDGPVLKDAWSCTPYAVADAMMDRFVSSTRLLRMIPRSALYAALRASRIRSKEILSFCEKSSGRARFPGLLTGPSMHAHLLAEEGVTGCVPNIRIPGAAAVVGHCHEKSHIEVFIPSCDDITAPHSEPVPNRTYRSELVSVSVPSLDLAKDPILTAVRGLVRTCVAAGAGEMDGNAMYRSVMAMWGCAGASMPSVSCPAASHFRMLSCTQKVEHSVRMSPNYSSRIKVSCARGLEHYRSVSKAFDWITLLFFVRAIAAVDADAGFAGALHAGGYGQFSRHYTVLMGPSLVRSKATRGVRVAPVCAAQSCPAGDSAKAFHDLLFDQVGESMDDCPDSIIERVAGAVGSEVRFKTKVAFSRLKAPADMGDLLRSLATSVVTAPRAADNTDVSSYVRVDIGVDPVAKWVRKWREMKGPEFARAVADSGDDLSTLLSETRVGRSLKKQVFSRDEVRCSAAMAVLSEARDSAGVGSVGVLARYRLASAERHRAKVNSTPCNAPGRARSILAWHGGERLSRAAANSSEVQILELLEGLSAAVSFIMGASGSHVEGRVIAAVRAKKADWLKGGNALSLASFRKAVAAFLDQNGELPEDDYRSLMDTSVELYGWVMDDTASTEARDAEIARSTNVAHQAPAADSAGIDSILALMGGGFKFGAETFGTDDDAACAEGNADV